MALQVKLTLSKTYFLPGELVEVCVQIFNERVSTIEEDSQGAAAPQVLHVKELSFQANGSERTDSSFVHRLHRPEVPADATVSRKRVRNIFSTESALLISDSVLAPYAARSFQLRFRLPTALPPTFRGSAVRFFYMIHVKAVYEVQKGNREAVVYETTASTTLTVWPNNNTMVPGMQISSVSANLADRRSSSLSHSFGRASDNPLGSDKTGDQGDAASSKMEPGGNIWLNGVSSSVPSLPAATGLPHVSNSHGGLCSSGGGDDGDVPCCDYVLDRTCRIRWQELHSACGNDYMPGLQALESLPRAAEGTANRPFAGAGAAAVFPRGVIPFGINGSFDAPLMLPIVTSDTESDDFNAGRDGGFSTAGCPGYSNLPATGNDNATVAAQGSPHVQRQLSQGATGLPPFARNSLRRNSLFGKVYMLNVGDQPLLRVMLHAPLEVPLQPGATFGGVLDFRQPRQAVAASQSADRQVMACYGVAVLLETEEVISPACRPQAKRDGEGGGGSATPYVIRRLHAEHHELPSDGALSSFMFSLPSTATPSFRTPMVSLRWVLRFELTVGPQIHFAAIDRRVRAVRPHLEQLVWSLPLKLKSPVTLTR